MVKKSYANTLNGFFKYVQDNMTPKTIVTMDDKGTYKLEFTDGMVLGSYAPNVGLKTYYFKE